MCLLNKKKELNEKLEELREEVSKKLKKPKVFSDFMTMGNIIKITLFLIIL